MPTQIFEVTLEVARVAAKDAIETLGAAIASNGSATWVLAGGTSPTSAYEEIVEKYADALDWSKVTVLIGDERIVPLDSPDSNWGTILPLFDDNRYLSKIQRIVPQPELGEVKAAQLYSEAINTLGKKFDLVWVGVGEDGHTLSLFPKHPGLMDSTDALVIPIYEAPKLPPVRMSLSLKGLERVSKLVIFAVGESKRTALKRARIDPQLPIAKAASVVEKSGGIVEWLFDRDAAGPDAR